MLQRDASKVTSWVGSAPQWAVEWTYPIHSVYHTGWLPASGSRLGNSDVQRCNRGEKDMRKVLIATLLAGAFGLVGTAPTLSAPVSGTALQPALDGNLLTQIQYCERYRRCYGYGYNRRCEWVRRCRGGGGGYYYQPY
jgi:hypothetical protein